MKGQSALEYLITYGWALIIIVVVGVALYTLGVLNPATYSSNDKNSYCASLKNITIENQEVMGCYWTGFDNCCACEVMEQDERGIYKREICYKIPEELQ